ncbi:MAG: hypothetical protein H7A32_01075 [Deltaproteobacteria bacterium]|nr:hypothetical protein [Deltaproteobacteria bacterium]
MKTEAYLAGIGYYLPSPVSTEKYLEIDKKMREFNGQSEEIIKLARKFVLNTGIKQRHTLHPAFLDEPGEENIEDIFTEEDFDPPLWRRLKFFKDHAPKLALKAAQKAIADWGGSVDDISHIITTSTSGWMEPGLACSLIEELGLGEDTQKAELFFNGCFCGATCLRLARDTVRAGESKAVLVVAMEMAMTHYDPVDTHISTLVASSLFGDGAAAVVVAPEGKWKFEKAGMTVIPGTKDLLRFTPPITPDKHAYEIYLDRNVGKSLYNYFSNPDKGKKLLKKILDMAGGEFPALAVHPGGPNILENVLNAYTEIGFPPNALDISFQTLESLGNLSSAAMLFVLANTLKDCQSDKLATFAFGPGVTIEWGYYSKA